MSPEENLRQGPGELKKKNFGEIKGEILGYSPLDVLEVLDVQVKSKSNFRF